MAAKEKPFELKFSKEQLMKSSKYASNVDMLGAILLDSKQYTIDEVDKAIDKFMKRKVD